MADFTFDVPGSPPSVNHLYVRARGDWSRMAKAKGVEQYQSDAGWLCRAARPSGWSAPGQIRVEYEFHLGRDADCDNLLKSLQDSVAAALGVNDRVMLPCVLSKTIGNKSPWVRVFVTALPSPSPEAPRSPARAACSASSSTSPRPSPASRRAVGSS